MLKWYCWNIFSIWCGYEFWGRTECIEWYECKNWWPAMFFFGLYNSKCFNL